MIDYRFLFAAIVIMLVIIINDILKRKTSIDMDKIDVGVYFKKFVNYISRMLSVTIKRKYSSHSFVIEKNTGSNSLYLASCGDNQATVMATLRQITGISKDHANWIAQAVPTVFMRNISDDEADMTKKALEFVGAKVDIK
jgi:ribosomal protein L7/L12